MPMMLTAAHVQLSLAAHASAKGADLRHKYGSQIGWSELLAVLQDRAYVRYPCEIVFDSASLHPGELAYPALQTSSPEDGFTIYVHPFFKSRLDEVPLLVLYQVVLVNYGEIADAEVAEQFGAAVFGLSTASYRAAICKLADELAAATNANGECASTASEADAGSEAWCSFPFQSPNPSKVNT